MTLKRIFQTFMILLDKALSSFIANANHLENKRICIVATVPVFNSFPFRRRSLKKIFPKAVIMAMALVLGGLFLPNASFATRFQVTSTSVGAASGNAAYGTASTGGTAISYTITFTETSGPGAQKSDGISLVWTGGAPSGVSTNLATTYTPGGNGQTITFTISTTATTPAGSYNFTINTTTGNGGSNTVSNTGVLVVNKATLTESGAIASNKVYDGTTNATVTGGTLSGVKGSDVVSVSTTGTFASPNVGTGIAVTLLLTGANSGNYTLTQPSITANITAAPLSITATGPAKPYGTVLTAGASSTDFTAVGMAATETVTSVTLTPNAVGLSATAAVGSTYTVTPSAAMGSGGFLASNYTITFNTFSGTVTAASLTITATGPSLSLGGIFTNGAYTNTSTPVYFVTSATAVSGETVTGVTLTASPTLDGTQLIGTAYAITPSAATGTGGFLASNYNITYVVYNDKISNNSYTWTGAGGDANWNTDANWTAAKSPATHPNVFDDVNIGVTTYAGQQPVINAGGTTTCSTLTFGPNGGGAVTLTLNSGNSLAITSGMTFNTSAATVSIVNNGAITIGGDFTSNSGAILDASSGSGTFSIAGVYNNIGTTTFGPGTVSVSGAYINTGITTFGAGAVNLSGDYNNSGANTFGAGNVTMTGAFTNTGNTTFNSNSQLVFNATGPAATFISTTVASPITLYNTSFSGTNGKYLFHTTGGHGTGTFSVASTAVLTLSNSSTVNITNAQFVLLSDQNSSATVAPLPAGCTFTGTVTVQRYLSAHRGYRLMASPVYAGTVGSNNIYSLNYVSNSAYITGFAGAAGGFDKASNPTLYLYREDVPVSNVGFASGNYRAINDLTAAPDYTVYLDGVFNIPVSNGYLFFFRGDRAKATLAQATTVGAGATEATFSTSGTLNQGQVAFSDWYNPGSNLLGFSNADITAKGFNLAGNPYASSIDWETYNTTTPTVGIYAHGVSAFVYELNPTTENYDVYEAGTIPLGSVFTNNGSRNIASGQGFFVQAISASAQLIFNESAKVNTQNTSASGNLMMGTPANQTANRYLRLRLAMDTVNTDDIVIRFNPDSKARYDIGEDAASIIGSGKLNLASFSCDHKALAINTLPLAIKGDTISLRVGATAGGAYTLKMTDIKGIPQLYDIWLKDAYTEASVNMRDSSAYSFTIDKTDTNTFGERRFSLSLVQNPALAYKLLSFDAEKTGKVHGVQLSWTTENEENYTNFTVERSNDNGKTYDVAGSILSTGAGAYGLLDQGAQKGDNLYRLKTVDFNNNVSYSNVVDIQFQDNGNNKSSHLSIFPNPATDIINLTIEPKTQGNTSYNIKISNSSGMVVKYVAVKDTNWQDNVSDLLTGTYMIEVVDRHDNSLVGQTKFVKL